MVRAEIRRAGLGERRMSLRIRRIDQAQDFMSLAPLWAQLAGKSGQLSPFLSFDWFWCCWHGVWPQCRPEILVIEEAGSPVAIIPLMHWRAWCRGLPVRYIGFLDCPSSPLVDVLTVAEHDRVIETLLDHLVGRSDWDTACLQKLPVNSPTLKALESLLPERFPWHRAGHVLYPYLAIDGDWERFYGAADLSLQETHRRVQAQLKRAGGVHIEEHRTVDLQSALFLEMLDIISRRGKTDRDLGIAPMRRTREFFCELTRRACKNGWLSLWSLRLDGHVLAIEYQLRANGKIQTLWAWDDAVNRDFLPGRALHLAILQSLFEGGRVYEYSVGPAVRGDCLWWATGHHETVHLQIYRTGIYSGMLHRLETAVAPWAQKWHERARASLT